LLSPAATPLSRAAAFEGEVLEVAHAVVVRAIASPFLQDAGLELRAALALGDIECAHPLDDGSAALIHRSAVDTAAGPGEDQVRWRALIGAGDLRFPCRHGLRLFLVVGGSVGDEVELVALDVGERGPLGDGVLDLSCSAVQFIAALTD
jgi:hypothetical protein